MPKYLYFQDGHVKGKNPINYVGDFFSDFLVQVDNLLTIAKKNNVDAIIDGGDLFDSHSPSYRVLDEIADRVEACGIPIYSLFGNHAERYHSMQHSKYTGLAHLQKRSKLFEYLDVISPGDSKPEDDFFIGGIEYSHDVEEQLKEKGIPIGTHKTWKIVVAHAFICPKEFPYASHVVCDDIKTNADIVLVAHYHAEWEKQVGKTLYKDIGCFGRKSVTEASITPSCLLIDTESRTLTEIEVEAKKGEEIFQLDKIQEIKEFDADLLRFIQSMESTEFQAADIRINIKELAKAKDMNPEVVKLVMTKLNEVEDEN